MESLSDLFMYMTVCVCHQRVLICVLKAWISAGDGPELAERWSWELKGGAGVCGAAQRDKGGG